MNYLYLLERTDKDRGHDEFWGFVISAPTPLRARNIASAKSRDEGEQTWQEKAITVRRIDINGTSEPEGVVLSDYNEG